jgi:hypothetical protein
MTNPNNLPSQINVTRAVTYEVDEVMLADISTATGKDENDITLKDVLWWLEDWVSEDFPNADRDTLTYQNDKGEVIHAI